MLATNTSNPITFQYLKREIGAVVVQSPDAVQKTLKVLTARILTEMTLKDINRLERIAQSHTGTEISMVGALTTSIIKSLMEEVKSVKCEVHKIEKAAKLINRGHLNEAEALLNEVNNPDLKTDVENILCLIAAKRKTDTLDAKKKKDSIVETFPESTEEKVVVDTGIDLINSGMNNLRIATGAHGRLPTNSQMGEAVRGLHNMSLTAHGRRQDSSLEQDSISELEEKLAAAEKELAIERQNFDRALLTGDQNRIMKALKQKQEVMQKVLFLQSALHSRGVSQTTEKDNVETINEAIRQGYSTLKEAVRNSGIPIDKEEEEQIDCKLS